MEQEDPFYPFVFKEYITSDKFTPYCQLTTDLQVLGNGLAYLNDTTIEQLEMANGEYCNYIFLADIKNKKLIDCIQFDDEHNGFSMDITSYDGTLDLDSSGSRWEGQCVCYSPCGWGCLYDARGYLVYEGFRFMDKAVCYGRYYHEESSQVAYEGSIHNGQRWGRGQCMDIVGEVIYKGDWLCDVPLFRVDKHILHSYSCSLEVHFSDSVFPNFYVLRALKKLVVSFCSCRCVKSLYLKERPFLEEVVIESFSFTSLRKELYNSNDPAIVTISHCPKLRMISIDENCFRDSRECSICHNDSLKKIKIGGRCFVQCDVVDISSNKSLKKLCIDGMTFPDCSRVLLANMPCLTVLNIGFCTFMGSLKGCTVSLRDLPKLSHFESTSLNFRNVDNLDISGIPEETREIIMEDAENQKSDIIYGEPPIWKLFSS